MIKIDKLLSVLRLIDDGSRLTILVSLGSKEWCVNDIVLKTSLSQSLVSHHLKDLKDGGLVAAKKNGRWVYYCLTDKGRQVMAVLEGITNE